MLRVRPRRLAGDLPHFHRAVRLVIPPSRLRLDPYMTSLSIRHSFASLTSPTLPALRRRLLVHRQPPGAMPPSVVATLTPIPDADRAAILAYAKPRLFDTIFHRARLCVVTSASNDTVPALQHADYTCPFGIIPRASVTSPTARVLRAPSALVSVTTSSAIFAV